MMLHDAAITDKVINNWWSNLPKEVQEKYMKKFFTVEMQRNINVNEVFNNLPGKDKLWFYEQMRRNYWDDFSRKRRI